MALFYVKSGLEVIRKPQEQRPWSPVLNKIWDFYVKKLFQTCCRWSFAALPALPVANNVNRKAANTHMEACTPIGNNNNIKADTKLDMWQKSFVRHVARRCHVCVYRSYFNTGEEIQEEIQEIKWFINFCCRFFIMESRWWLLWIPDNSYVEILPQDLDVAVFGRLQMSWFGSRKSKFLTRNLDGNE